MTDFSWRDFETHLMQQGPTANDTFHAVRSCPRLDQPEKTIKRNEHYVGYHEPDPCPVCHPEVPAGDGADELVIVTADEPHRYHRSENCYYVAQMDATERIRVSAAEDDGLQACKRCAAGDRDDAEDIEVCPDCDRTQIQRVIGSSHSPGDGDHDYRCNECGARFDEPDKRARQHSPGNPGGLAGKLMQADPDDLGADAGEPMTDGGSEPAPKRSDVAGKWSVWCADCGAKNHKNASECSACGYGSGQGTFGVGDWRYVGAPEYTSDGEAGRFDRSEEPDSGPHAGEPMTDGGEDVVYYASGMYKVYHRDRDCRYLQLADGVSEQRVSTLNGTREPCGVCAQADAEETGKLVTDGGSA